MMKRMASATRLAPALAVVLALAACGKQADEKGAKAAGGDVLPGTISDAMIDTSHSQAQAPMMPAKAEKIRPGEASDAASETADDSGSVDGAAKAGAAAAPEAPTEASTPAAKPMPKPMPKPKSTAATAKPSAKPTAN